MRRGCKQSGGLFARQTRYGGLLPDEMRRLKPLEDENARLKKIVADLTLDRDML